MKSKRRVDLLGLGISPVDFYVSMSGYPEAGEKIDGIAGSRVICGGGPVPTALCTFSKLGGTTSLIAGLGGDRWGRFVRAELNTFGVGHKHCLVRGNRTNALAFAWVDINSGERTIVLDMDRRLHLRPADIKLTDLPLPRLIHLDGRDVAACVKLARWGKKVGAKIMLDVGSVRNRVDDLFPFIDYLICADQFALHYTRSKSSRTAVRKLKKLGLPEVVVTSGIGGSYGSDEFTEIRQRAFKVGAVDVTGAGDVFHGAYLFGIMKNWPMTKKLKFASAAAALKCKKPGARAGIPSYNLTMKFMKNHRAFYA